MLDGWSFSGSVGRCVVILKLHIHAPIGELAYLEVWYRELPVHPEVQAWACGTVGVQEHVRELKKKKIT